ncbi:MAG: hypothetical protein ABR927_19160 [Bacteroidales bacterium]|jgi:hypothetical protein
MNEEELKRLIEKYYNGESTEEEERTLRDYFRKNNIPEGYEAEKLIFSYYTETVEVPEPSIDFEARILAGIDASEMNRGSGKMKKYLLPLLSAAAGLLILTGSYFFFFNRAETRDSFTDPEIAYAETIKILRDVSAQLNHGAQVLEPVGKMDEITRKSFESLNRSTRIVKKNLRNLDYLQRAIEISHVTIDKNINK